MEKRVEEKQNNTLYILLTVVITILMGGVIYYFNYVYDNSFYDVSTPNDKTDISICQNAQDNDLCEGLDLAYGSGYEKLCCFEKGVCCQDAT